MKKNTRRGYFIYLLLFLSLILFSITAKKSNAEDFIEISSPKIELSGLDRNAHRTIILRPLELIGQALDATLGTLVGVFTPRSLKIKIIANSIADKAKETKILREYLTDKEIRDISYTIAKNNVPKYSPLSHRSHLMKVSVYAFAQAILKKSITENVPSELLTKRLLLQAIRYSTKNLKKCLADAAKKDKRGKLQIRDHLFEQKLKNCTEAFAYEAPLRMGSAIYQMIVDAKVKTYYPWKKLHKYQEVKQKGLNQYVKCGHKRFLKKTATFGDIGKKVKSCVYAGMLTAIKYTVAEVAIIRAHNVLKNNWKLRRSVKRSLLGETVKFYRLHRFIGFNSSQYNYAYLENLSAQRLEMLADRLIHNITIMAGKVIAKETIKSHQLVKKYLNKKEGEEVAAQTIDFAYLPCMKAQAHNPDPYKCIEVMTSFTASFVVKKVIMQNFTELIQSESTGPKTDRRTSKKTSDYLKAQDKVEKEINRCFQNSRNMMLDQLRKGRATSKADWHIRSCTKGSIVKMTEELAKVLLKKEISNHHILKKHREKFSYKVINSIGKTAGSCMHTKLEEAYSVEDIAKKAKQSAKICKLRAYKKVVLTVLPWELEERLRPYLKTDQRLAIGVNYLVNEGKTKVQNANSIEGLMKIVDTFTEMVAFYVYEDTLEAELKKYFPLEGEDISLITRLLNGVVWKSFLSEFLSAKYRERLKRAVREKKLAQFKSAIELEVIGKFTFILTRRKVFEYINDSGPLDKIAKAASKYMVQCFIEKSDMAFCRKGTETFSFKQVVNQLYQDDVIEYFEESRKLEKKFKKEFDRTVEQCITNNSGNKKWIKKCASKIKDFSSKRIPYLLLDESLKENLPGSEGSNNYKLRTAIRNKRYNEYLKRYGKNPKRLSQHVNLLRKDVLIDVSQEVIKRSLQEYLGSDKETISALIGGGQQRLKNCLDGLPLGLDGKEYKKNTMHCLGGEIVELARSVGKRIIGHLSLVVGKNAEKEIYNNYQHCLEGIGDLHNSTAVMRAVEECSSELQENFLVVLRTQFIDKSPQNSSDYRDRYGKVFDLAVYLVKIALKYRVESTMDMDAKDSDTTSTSFIIDRSIVIKLKGVIEMVARYLSIAVKYHPEKVLPEIDNLHYETTLLSLDADGSELLEYVNKIVELPLIKLLVGSFIGNLILNGDYRSKVKGLLSVFKQMYEKEKELYDYSNRRLKEIDRRYNGLFSQSKYVTSRFVIDKDLSNLKPGKKLLQFIKQMIKKVAAIYLYTKDPNGKRMEIVKFKIGQYLKKNFPILRNMVAEMIGADLRVGGFNESLLGAIASSKLRYELKYRSFWTKIGLKLGSITKDDFLWHKINTRKSAKLAIKKFAEKLIVPSIKGETLTEKSINKTSKELKELMIKAVKNK